MINKERPYSRPDRVADSIKSILGEIFINKLFIEQNGIITITNVSVSRDLRYAKVFFSHIDTVLENSELEKKLNQNKSKIKYLR